MLPDLGFAMLEFDQPSLRRLVRGPWSMSYGEGDALPGVAVPDAHVEFAAANLGFIFAYVAGLKLALKRSAVHA